MVRDEVLNVNFLDLVHINNNNYKRGFFNREKVNKIYKDSVILSNSILIYYNLNKIIYASFKESVLVILSVYLGKIYKLIEFIKSTKKLAVLNWNANTFSIT